MAKTALKKKQHMRPALTRAARVAPRPVPAARHQMVEPTRFRAPPIAIRLTESDEGIHVPSEIQLFKTGSFKRLNPKGKWETFDITREHLEEMVENFSEGVRGVDIAIDFGHRSDEEAAAWVRGLEIREVGKECQLWAEVEWTTDGYAAVSGKKFRYFSPDFAFSYTDNETGEKYGTILFGGGLTNRPVIKNMAPAVELTEVDDMAKKTKITPKKIADLTVDELRVRLSEETDEERKEFWQEILDRRVELDEAASAAEEEEEIEEVAPKTCDEMSLEELRPAFKKMSEELAELKKNQAKTMAEAATALKKSQFDGFLKEGKVVEAQRAPFMEGNTIKFAELAQTPKFETIGTGGDTGGGTKPTTAMAEVIKLAEVKVTEKKAKTKLAAMRMVLSENPELNKRYQAESNGDNE